jgi:hypothetical protein
MVRSVFIGSVSFREAPGREGTSRARISKPHQQAAPQSLTIDWSNGSLLA